MVAPAVPAARRSRTAAAVAAAVRTSAQSRTSAARVRRRRVRAVRSAAVGDSSRSQLPVHAATDGFGGPAGGGAGGVAMGSAKRPGSAKAGAECEAAGGWPADWTGRTRPRLAAVRRASRAALGGAAARRKALALLGRAEAFGGVVTAEDGPDRGRVLHGAVLAALEDVVLALPAGPARTAARLWLAYASEGCRQADLVGRFGGTGADAPAATPGKVRYLMGATHAGDGHGAPDAYRELTERVDALLAGLAEPGDEDGRLRVAGAWPALAAEPSARALLGHLAAAADAPMVLPVLEDAAHAGLLPSALADALRRGTPRPAAPAVLARLGLADRIVVDGSAAVRLRPGVHAAARGRLPGDWLARARSRLLRLFDLTLPDDATGPAGAAWVPGFPHAVAMALAVEADSDDRRLLGRAGRLLNTASAHARLVLLDKRRAHELGLAALRAHDRAGRPDMEDYNAARVNTAAADPDPATALGLIEQALAHRLERLAPDDPVLLGTRLALANALAHDGRPDEARAAYAALTEDVDAADVEALHDRAAFLLHETLRGRGG